MVIIGLCGTSGSGKGYVCEEFKAHGVEFIDTDKVYSTKIVRAGSDCLNELCDFFGKEILNSDGSLNRGVLSSRVFEEEHSEENLKVLNSITHRYIRHDVETTISALRKNGARAVVIDAPVLFESGFDDMCDATICVTAPLEIKLQRILDRDKITSQRAMARLGNQLTEDKLRTLCDYEIVNDGTYSVSEQVAEIIRKLDLGE